MFQFGRFPAFNYVFIKRSYIMCIWGFPIRTFTDIAPICGSPWLFAAYRVLLRLLTPRHSPYALFSLNYFLREFLSYYWYLSTSVTRFPISQYLLRVPRLYTSPSFVSNVGDDTERLFFCSRSPNRQQNLDTVISSSRFNRDDYYINLKLYTIPRVLQILSSRFYSVFNVQSFSINN